MDCDRSRPAPLLCADAAALLRLGAVEVNHL
jgi:hypothetical protein